jgi:transmembrane sensor
MVMPNSTDTDRDPLLNEALDWVIKTHSGSPDASAHVDLQRWIARSDQHAAAYRKARSIWQLTGDLAPGSSVRRAGQTALPARRRRRLWYIAALSAGVAAVILLAVSSRTIRIALEADYSTGTGETRRISLSDGSTVDINADTAIAVELSTAARQVTLLAGEGFFDIARADRRPFLVQAGSLSVLALGTAFDVVLRAGSIDVAVQQGDVQVVADRAKTTGAQRLASGDRISVDRATGTSIISTTSAERIGAWRSGKLIAAKASIGQVIDELRHYYHGLIIVRDERLTRQLITGIYDLHDPVAALTAAVAPHGGTVAHVTPFLLVVSGAD